MHSYRDVIDVVERRIFRVDRWRIPSPGGLPVVAVGYFAALVACVLVASKLPIVGQLLGILPPAVRVLALPVLGAWALVGWQVDGRRPHHALWAWCRSRVAPRTLAGLRRTPAVGTQLAPIEGVTIAPSGDEPHYRAGRLRGPATVILRYPAELAVERRCALRGRSAVGELADAERIRVTALSDRVQPLLSGREIRVPNGGEVVFE